METIVKFQLDIHLIFKISLKLVNSENNYNFFHYLINIKFLRRHLSSWIEWKPLQMILDLESTNSL